MTAVLSSSVVEPKNAEFQFLLLQTCGSPRPPLEDLEGEKKVTQPDHNFLLPFVVWEIVNAQWLGGLAEISNMVISLAHIFRSI